MSAPRRVHVPSGFTSTSTGKVRAYCSCGERTTPRVDQRRAVEALESRHGYSSARCELCGHDYDADIDVPRGRRYDRLEVLTDPELGDQALVCRDAPQRCRDGAARRQVQLDRAAADALDVELPRPRLRVVR